MKVDWVIVGAGLTGATMAERIASQRSETVLLIEQRDHIAGNSWDEYNEHGILEHKYGPHIFHTNSRTVWQYLSQFTEWTPYFHKVLCSVDGQLVPLPFNLNSIEQLFPHALATRLTDKLMADYGYGSRVPILKLCETNDIELRFLADYVCKNIFENYSRKQWGMRLEELADSVTARVPILISRDDRYFQDIYQAIPLQGYGAMVRKMLRHSKIKILLNTRWQEIKDNVAYERMVFTGPIDEFFEYKYGQLPYRSIRFDVQTYAFERYQTAAVINFPNEYDLTRISEPKWLTGQLIKHTTTLSEYPIPHVVGATVPYYPIPTDENGRRYERYQQEARALGSKVFFAGRLADYKYYNMDQVVDRALTIVAGI